MDALYLLSYAGMGFGAVGGLEPPRLPIRPSNVRVYQFRHHRGLRDNGAGNGIRTRDPCLGKAMLYH